MPANLTPQYLEAERRYKGAATDEERLEALREMFRLLPKHKGTEKMQADLKKKISALSKSRGRKSGPARSTPLFHVPPEGAGQVVLLGPPNCGKSSLLAALTNARPEIADYPFTTQKPAPGMMQFEDAKVQLVDLPPVSAEHVESWIPECIRRADAVAALVDLGDDDLLDGMEAVLATLDRSHVVTAAAEADPPSVLHKPVLLVATKGDLAGADERWGIVREFYGKRFPALRVSASSGSGLDALRGRLFAALDVVRVYTRDPRNKKSIGEPYTVPRGATVLDVAERVHKDIASNLKYARIWGSERYDGQAVQRDHVLEDGDVLEFHA
jgi:ribosome-interacting GTPase 1